MAYDSKTIPELERLATNLRAQIAVRPKCKLERTELKECKRWIELRRRELNASAIYQARAVVWPKKSTAATET